MTNAESIFKSLTLAQLRALNRLAVPDGPGKWPCRNALTDKGLLETWPSYGWTALAYRVRAHIKSDQLSMETQDGG